MDMAAEHGDAARMGSPGDHFSRTMLMKILFLTTVHNSLSQRLWIELSERGHKISVCIAQSGETMRDAVSREAPDFILAPMLKTAIPKDIWSRHLCLIVHPGIKGDRGPSSLDWAIANDERSWGVTILEAAEEFDAGPVWASHEFALEADSPAKSSLYRGQVTEAAVRGVLEAVARIESGAYASGTWRPEACPIHRQAFAAVCARPWAIRPRHRLGLRFDRCHLAENLRRR